ncbi:MAG: hypothetical protein UT63_C0057G0004 [Candidatus Gottesmanbacteria bacterium GW2011_GWC2_39_8]|uniref:Glycosyltransferase RgtA/B/C/D-like domain-containing protein n=1 Tax=Candidatus Gottesmanbacteria bacterium GW2011_GWC2_39_8 TaxID=1618450 RepID=A0A0G0Q3F1_9BACT|nr:MAG: hypothetical protein UT63_C0057G0004 [Candidatus Gottesmanbacteria bacterium GW2011_GWC2_39_8]
MLFILLLVSFVVRLIGLTQSLWLDEGISVVAVKSYSYLGLISKFSLSDVHPPLYYLILKLWTSVFGYSEISLRFPSVILGVGTVYVLYQIGKKVQGKQLGLTAAFIYALNPLAIYYSQEARMHSLAAFLAVFTAFILLSFTKKDNLKNMLLLIFSSVLLLYSEYYGALVWGAFVLFIFLFERKSKWIKKFIIAEITAAIFLLPWAGIFLNQFKEGIGMALSVPAWGSVVGSLSMKNIVLVPVKFIFGRISFNNKILYGLASMSVAVFYFFLILSGLKTKYSIDSNLKKLILLWFLVPVVSAFIISFKVPVFSYHRLLVVLPAFILLTALGITGIKTRKIRYIFLGVIASVSILSLVIFFSDKSNQREDWRGSVEFLQKASPYSLILFKSDQVFAPFLYYREKYKVTTPLSGVSDKFTVNPVYLHNHLPKLVKDVNNVYLYGYLGDVTDPAHNTEKELESLGYKEIKTYDFPGVGFVYKYVKL